MRFSTLTKKKSCYVDDYTRNEAHDTERVDPEADEHTMTLERVRLERVKRSDIRVQRCVQEYVEIDDEEGCQENTLERCRLFELEERHQRRKSHSDTSHG
jgi:hypothetical protein